MASLHLQIALKVDSTELSFEGDSVWKGSWLCEGILLRLRKSERTAHLVIQLLQSIVLLPNIAVLFGSGVLCKLCKQDKERSLLVLCRGSCMAECSDLIQCKQRERKWAEIVIKGNCPGLKAWLQSLKFNGDLRCVHSLCSLRWFLFSVERESEKKRKWKWAKTCGMRRAKGTITGWWACACNGNLRCVHLLCSLWWFRFQCWKRKWNRKRKWK